MSASPILLNEVWPFDRPTDLKIHFARWNKRAQPLEVLARDRREWQQWQEYRPSKNDFNRPYIFALARFYHEPDAWLFGGLYRVVERLPDRYVVQPEEAGEKFVGRLKLRVVHRERQTRAKFEGFKDSMEVQEILRSPYTGRTFPGFESIDLSFEELETIVRNARPDWMSPLASMKGIYLISDINTGKRYVGAAFGVQGIWGRWCEYITSGHGGNVELRKLVSDPTLEYVRRSFRFALLEHRPVATPDSIILMREQFWKGILLSRGAQGLNRN